MKKIKSFTLAEVLITLVVIGIIAAVTVPVVMANHKKTETATRLKKFYANLSNAVKLAEIENGTSVVEWMEDEEITQVKDIWDKYLYKYIPYNKYITPGEFDSYGFEYTHSTLACGSAIILNDGTAVCFDATDNLGFDVNGEKGPNRYGRDIFDFHLLTPLMESEFRYSNIEPKHVYTDFCIDGNCTREAIIEKCRTSGSCTLLLEMDGWEFKDDYPLRP